MKKLLGCGALCLSLLGPASAVVIDFENGQLPAQFNYSNIGNLYTPDYFTQDTGYVRGRTSGAWVGYTSTLGTISSATPFDFVGGSFTAAWNDDLEVTLVGQLGGIEQYRSNFIMSDDFPSLLTLNFHSIDTLQIWTAGGVDAGTPGGGNHVALDDLVFQAATVPETSMSDLVRCL